jgi:hypothetical protein
MDDLLKDAIADAKAVRETALENAKIALEEAFTPRLQSMLSKKIQSEMEHEDEDDVEERAHEDEDEVEERGEMRRSGDELDDDEPSEAMHDDEEDDVDEGEHEEDEVDESQVIEIDGVKYAPVVSEEEDEDEVEEGEERGDDDEVDEDLDLDEILKELEEEEDNEDEIDEIEEGEHEDDDKEDVDEEVDQSSGIGSSDNKKGSADKSSGIGSKGKAKHESVEVNEEDKEDEDEVDEDIDLEEIVKALSEEEDEEKEVEEVSKLQSELDEHRNVVKYLRSKLNEVNLLNAKLLFTNKLFRSYGLNNDQKMKVVETFDRAHNLREVKLVYSTLAESFGSKQTKTEIKESKKGSASKAVASTKSEKQEVIAEGHEMRDRFKKLAGIL